jgi:hypothetical protein
MKYTTLTYPTYVATIALSTYPLEQNYWLEEPFMSTPRASTTTTLENIRGAFLLGWSVVELKSRILINAFTTAMDPVTLEDIARSSPTLTFQQRLPKDATMSRASNLIYTERQAVVVRLINQRR